MSARRTDVLVVGAGPAGSASAALFARAGYDVRLLDRAAFPRFKACGDFLSPECNRILERLGVQDEVRRSGARRLRGLLVSAYGEPPLRADFDAGCRAFGYALERTLLDSILVSAARAAGAEAMEGWTVEGLAGEGAVRVRGRDGECAVWRARLIIGAGGKRCPVARDLGVQQRPSSAGRIDLLCHWSGLDAARPYCEMHVRSPGYIGVAAAGPTIVNVNAVVPRSWLRARIRRRDEWRNRGSVEVRTDIYRELLSVSPEVRRVIENGRALYAPVASDVTLLTTTRASAEGVLLVGDAALFIDPFTGQGIYLALRSAELALEVGTAALHSRDPSARRLAAYDRLRAREFTPKVRLSRLLQLILYRPWLARRVAAALRRDPQSASRLIGVIGDYRPAADLLSPTFLTRVTSASLGATQA